MSKNNAAKKLLNSFISLFLRNKRYDKGINPDKVKKILVIRNDALGDMLITMPAIALLKKAATHAEIHVLASKKSFRLLENDSNVDNLHIAEEGKLSFFKQMLTLRKEKFDVIISTIYVGITKQGFIANIIGGRKAFKSLLYSGEEKYTYYNFQSKTAEKQIAMWEKMYAQFAETFALSTNVDKVIPYLQTSESDKKTLNILLEELDLKYKEYLVVNLSAGQERNKIVKEDYVEILDILHRFFNKKIVLIHMPSENDLADNVKKEYTIALPKSDILTIAELIRNSILCVSPDTGIVHLASAVRTPTIGIFNSEYHSRFWAPYKVPGGKIVNGTNMLKEFEEIVSTLASKTGEENE